MRSMPFEPAPVISPSPAAQISQPAAPAAGMPRPAQAENSGLSINLSPRDRAIKDSIAAIDSAIAGGAQPTEEQAQRIAEVKRQAGFLRGGTYRVPVGPDGLPLQPAGGIRRVGNLDVQFAPGTSAQGIRDFMAFPDSTATWADENKQWRARQGFVEPPKGNELFTIQNAPLLTPQERMEYNKQLLINSQSDKVIASDAGLKAAKATAEIGAANLANANASVAPAKAAVDYAQAAAIPVDTASQKASREAQAARDLKQGDLYAQQAEQGKVIKFSQKTEDPRTFTKTETELGYGPGGKIIDPFGIRQNPLATLASGLTPAQRNIANKYIKPEQTDAEKTSILNKVISGGLK